MDPFQEINILGIISFCNIYLVPRVSPRMTVRHAGGDPGNKAIIYPVKERVILISTIVILPYRDVTYDRNITYM